MENMSWDDIRKRARNLETEIDMKLVALSKMSGGDSHSQTTPLLSSEFSFDTISLEIEDMLNKLGEINEKMANIPSSGAAVMHTLQRHRDIFNSYRSEFNKISSNHTIQVEREELLRGSGLMNGNSSPGTALSRRDMYVKETQHIANSSNMINDQIEIAIETQKSLKGQRRQFKKLQSRFNTLANTFPRINSLVQRINIKKRKDQLILAGVITACTILMLLYAFH